MTNRMRSTKSHTGKRRAHHGLEESSFVACEKCGEMKLPHRVCENCGTYGKREVIDILKKLTKKEKKKKEKELHEQEKHTEKGLDAAELSKK